MTSFCSSVIYIPSKFAGKERIFDSSHSIDFIAAGTGLDATRSSPTHRSPIITVEIDEPTRLMTAVMVWRRLDAVVGLGGPVVSAESDLGVLAIGSAAVLSGVGVTLDPSARVPGRQTQGGTNERWL